MSHPAAVTLLPLSHLLTPRFDEGSKGKTAVFHFNASGFNAGRITPEAAQGP